MNLITRISRLHDLTDEDLDAWRDLAARAVEPNVFFEPEFLLPAARALAPGQVSLAVVEDEDGRWHACAPVRRAPRWRSIRLPCLELWTHLYSGLEVPLVDPADVGGAVGALLGAMRHTRGAALVAMTQIPADGAYLQALRRVLPAGGGPLTIDSYERAAIRRRPEFTYVSEGMSKKRRHEVKRLRNGLEREHPDAVTAEDLADHPGAVDIFLRLEASGWKGRGGTAFASDPSHVAFFREMCASYSAVGRLQMVALCVDGTPIAMKCNLRSGDRLFTFKQAYDEAWSRWSPGRLVEVDNLMIFHDRSDAALIDSIAHPENAYINGMWPDRIALCSVVVPTSGPLGWAAGRVIAATLGIRARRHRPAHDPAIA